MMRNRQYLQLLYLLKGNPDNTFTGLVGTFKDGGPGGTPQTLLTPRILRASVQFKF
jgi:hypothetical protein